MKKLINPYVASFGWITEPPNPDAVDDQMLDESALTPGDVAHDFRSLIAAVARLDSSSHHLVADGRVEQLERYIGGHLREDVAGTIVNVASTYPASTAVDDVDLEATALCFWHCGLLVDLLTDVLPPKVRRAGHRIGCVQMFYDASSDQLETSVRLVRRGQCSLELSIQQGLTTMRTTPAWLDELGEAVAAKSAAPDEPNSVTPAKPDPDLEVGDLAAAIAAAITSGAKTLEYSGTTIASEITRVELASAIGRPIAMLEVVYSGSEGTLLVWEPGAQLPHSILLAA